MTSQQLAADHGTSEGAQQALNMLALFRVAVGTGRSVAFILERPARKEMCGCGNPECRVDPLFVVYQELLVSGDEVQADLAYRAYRCEEKLCVPRRSETPAETKARWEANPIPASDGDAVEMSAHDDEWLDFGGINEASHDAWKDSDARRL